MVTQSPLESNVAVHGHSPNIRDLEVEGWRVGTMSYIKFFIPWSCRRNSSMRSDVHSACLGHANCSTPEFPVYKMPFIGRLARVVEGFKRIAHAVCGDHSLGRESVICSP